MFKVYRCQVCGEVYLGSDKPKECPYCGAHQNYLKATEAEEYSRLDLPSSEISNKSQEDIREAIELEVDNYLFYSCAADRTEDENIAETFERLAKVEMEHAKALADLGGHDRSTIEDKEAELSQSGCESNIEANFKQSHEREARAIEEYSKFAKRASEPVVKKFFAALVAIERDHLQLSERKY